MPTTLLQLNDGMLGRSPVNSEPESHLEEIKKGAKASATAVKETENTSVDKVHLTARAESRPASEAVAAEARKGYDFLFVGLRDMLDNKGGFSKQVTEIADAFEGPLALVVSRKPDRIPRLEPGALLLVPVNGTAAARRAAEVALALARPHCLRVKALYVSPAPKGQQRRASLSRRREEAVLKDIMELAERYGVLIQTAMRARTAADVAICQEAAKGASMIVMGATQRPGKELFFGNTASAVLAACKCPIMLIGSERVRRSEPNTDTAREEQSEAVMVKKEKAA